MSRVVVMLEPTYLQNRENGLFAARFRSLGLTAYGDTREDALAALKSLFSFFVDKHREGGTLESFLTKAGVEWYPEENYPREKGHVEYLDGSQDMQRAGERHVEGRWAPDTILAA